MLPAAIWHPHVLTHRCLDNEYVRAASVLWKITRPPGWSFDRVCLPPFCLWFGPPVSCSYLKWEEVNTGKSIRLINNWCFDLFRHHKASYDKLVLLMQRRRKTGLLINHLYTDNRNSFLLLLAGSSIVSTALSFSNTSPFSIPAGYDVTLSNAIDAHAVMVEVASTLVHWCQTRNHPPKYALISCDLRVRNGCLLLQGKTKCSARCIWIKDLCAACRTLDRPIQ